MTVTQFGVTNALEYLIHNSMLNLNVVLINMIFIACVFSFDFTGLGHMCLLKKTSML